MLLTLTTTHRPATDLGYLLHKNPSKLHTFTLSFGQAHVFYPQADEHCCTAALLLDLDPIALVRDRRGPSGQGFALEQYVNDRPYVASSFLSVAIADVFGSALAGRSRERAELVEQAIPLTARLSAVPARGGPELVRQLFEPLGYAVQVTEHVLDDQFAAWGASPYVTIELSATCRLADLLAHLYVLIPVLDNDKHYWIGDDEVAKLLRHGEGWLANHPHKTLIATRYLRYRHHLARAALAQLLDEDQPDPDTQQEVHDHEEARAEEHLNLNQQRLGAVLAVLRGSGASRVIDLGCGEGNLLRILLAEKQFEHIVGMDVSWACLQRAQDRLKLADLPPRRRQRIELIQGSLMYRDRRLAGFDAAAVIEVIEHLDPPRLAAFERVLFEHARPGLVVLTTPNSEYNVKWATLPAGTLRHRDHRFEWTRAQFEGWAGGVAERFGYRVRFLPVGPVDDAVGSPTQMGVFER